MPKYNRKSLKITVRPDQLSPALLLVSLSDMKDYLKIDGSAEDTKLTGIINAVHDQICLTLRRSILTTSYELTMDRFSDRYIDVADMTGEGVFTGSRRALLGGSDHFGLPRPPVQSITSIKTYNDANTESTLDSAAYSLDTEGGRVYLNDGYTWPDNLRAYEAVKITYIGGYGDSGDVPPAIIQAAKEWAAKSYECGGMCDCPKSTAMAIAPYKLFDNLGFM